MGAGEVKKEVDPMDMIIDMKMAVKTINKESGRALAKEKQERAKVADVTIRGSYKDF